MLRKIVHCTVQSVHKYISIAIFLCMFRSKIEVNGFAFNKLAQVICKKLKAYYFVCSIFSIFYFVRQNSDFGCCTFCLFIKNYQEKIQANHQTITSPAPDIIRLKNMIFTFLPRFRVVSGEVSLITVEKIEIFIITAIALKCYNCNLNDIFKYKYNTMFSLALFVS